MRLCVEAAVAAPCPLGAHLALAGQIGRREPHRVGFRQQCEHPRVAALPAPRPTSLHNRRFCRQFASTHDGGAC